jgi:hypothetical protein
LSAIHGADLPCETYPFSQFGHDGRERLGQWLYVADGAQAWSSVSAFPYRDRVSWLAAVACVFENMKMEIEFPVPGSKSGKTAANHRLAPYWLLARGARENRIDLP